MDLTGTPPKLRVWGGINRVAAFQLGPWSANSRQGMLSGTVTLVPKTFHPIAVTLDMSSGDDLRFGPDFDSFSSVWTSAGRAQWYPATPPGLPRQNRWKIRVPGGHIPSPLRLTGRILALQEHPDILLQPEDLFAGSPPVRWIRGWLAFPYRPNKWGWATIRASGKASPLDIRFSVPESGAYQVLGRGMTRPKLSIQGHRLTCRTGARWTRCGRVTLATRQATLRIQGNRRTRLDALWLTRNVTGRSAVAHVVDPTRGSHMLAATLRQRLDRARCHYAEKVPDRLTWLRLASDIRRRLASSMDLPQRRDQPSAPKFLERGTVQGRGFEVQKLWIEGVDGIWASALLYRPHRPGPLPAVLHILGHYKKGKNRKAARILDANLAAAGIAVLAVDNLSFGDRRLRGRHRLEDNHFIGFWHVLAGSSAARVIYGETFRFVDYLWTRPWVDRRRIGVTGSSGGGTASLYLAALDHRISAASVVAAVSTWDHFGGFRGGDPEQYPAGLVTIADFPTLLALVAPRPLLVAGGARDDLFPAAQGRKAVHLAKRVFAMMGAAQAISFQGDRGPHGYKKARRDATLAFFTKLWTRRTLSHCLSKLALPAGRLHLGRPPSMPTLLDVARQRLAAQEATWSHVSASRKRARIAELVGLSSGPVPSTAPELALDPRQDFLAGLGRPVRLPLDQHRTLPGILMTSPNETGRRKDEARAVRPMVLAVADGGWRRFVTAHVFTNLGMDVLALDLSGWGELWPDQQTAYGLRHTWKRVEQLHGIESFFAAAYLLVSGDSLLALRTRELLSAIHAAKTTFPNRRIALATQGPISSMLAIVASIVEPRVEAVLVMDGISSMKRDMARAVRPLPDVTAPGLLALGDAGDLAALTRARIFFWAGAKDGRGRTAPVPHIPRLPNDQKTSGRLLQTFPNEAFWPKVISRWAGSWLQPQSR